MPDMASSMVETTRIPAKWATYVERLAPHLPQAGAQY